MQGGVVDAKSYFAVAKILCARPSWVIELSPDLTTCDTETSEPDHPHLAHAPRNGITACDQVPHCDQHIIYHHESLLNHSHFDLDKHNSEFAGLLFKKSSELAETEFSSAGM